MSKNTNSCPVERVGGQAVIEGIMMRGPKQYTTAVRTADGNIIRDTHVNSSVKDKIKILRLPIIRGIVNYIEMMILAFSTLNFAANALEYEEEETKFEKWLTSKLGDSLMTVVTTIGGILGVVLSLFLFIFLPAYVSDLVFGSADMYVWKKTLEGVLKIGIFVGYIALISLMPDIKRTFEYHGAEHKSIFCLEKGEELTVENIRKQKRFHPRCGTSFLFVMIILGVVLSSVVKIDNLVIYTLYKILTLPVLVGVGYEITMFAGKHDNFIVKILTAPGLWMQRLTTREPDDKQIEVAIVALKSALPHRFSDDEVFEGIVLPDIAEDKNTEEPAFENASQNTAEDTENNENA